MCGVGIARTLELPGHVQEGAEQSGAVVVQQLHQVCLEDEATEFDQVACALAPFACPIAGVLASTVGIKAVTQHRQPPQPCRCRLQLRQ